MNYIFTFVSIYILLSPYKAWSSDLKGITHSEIQWSICDQSSIETLKKIDKKILKEKSRELSYYDNHQLDLYKQGIQIRKRGVLHKYEMTAKVQFNTTQEIPWNWLSNKDYKCEQDLIGEKGVFACSIYSDYDSETFLNKSQIDLINMKNPAVILNDINEFGPVENHVWTLEYQYGEMVFDEIELPNQEHIYELSVRTDIGHESTVRSDIENLFATQNIQLCPKQLGKTIQVLTALLNQTL